MKPNKKHKIINDPVWGFITISNPLIFKLIEHPYFQRLRRIKQLGMSDMVYPGANHTRFAHALGAFHLMSQTINLLKRKGVEVSKEEEEAVCCGILLHDIGHGPFSHTLEFTIVKDIRHENLSLQIMEKINQELSGALDLTIAVFLNQYPKKFLHQLISSQLDMDRLDYLSRDSFYTGVSEGVIGAERLIHMLNVANGELVVEQKGIYSVEKFLIARRLMYWQVYLHKTVVIGDCMLQHILQRTAELLKTDVISPSLPLHYFLKGSIVNKTEMLESFLKLDDSDVFSVIKHGATLDDKVLYILCNQFINRDLWDITLSETPIKIGTKKLENIAQKLGISANEASYFVQEGKLENNAYMPEGEHINILQKDGEVVDVTTVSDNYNLNALKQKVVKYYAAWSE